MVDALVWVKSNLDLVVGIGVSVGVIWQWIAKPIRRVGGKIDAIEKSVLGVQGDTADLLNDRLQQSHDYYCARGWCSQTDKDRLMRMHARYRKMGRNHLAEHNEQDILELPELPPQGSAA